MQLAAAARAVARYYSVRHAKNELNMNTGPQNYHEGSLGHAPCEQEGPEARDVSTRADDAPDADDALYLEKPISGNPEINTGQKGLLTNEETGLRNRNKTL